MPKFKAAFGIFIPICVIIMYYNLKPISLQTEAVTDASQYLPNFKFDINKNDVFSFVHIQKTGGTTFEKHLVYNIKNGNCECDDSKKPSCMCYRRDRSEIWLICRYIKPTWPCGLHPDYASLRECSPMFMNDEFERRERQYYYGTLLRDPVTRFLSEFRHQQRGATWEKSAVLCKGKQFVEKTPKCHIGNVWLDLTLDKYMSCPFNLGINRQTWMLSNISRVTCNLKKMMDSKKLSRKLMSIAKKNLKQMAYFGLIEYPRESQFIFEKTFNLKFIEPFQLWDTGYAKVFMENVTDTMISEIKKVNKLDVELYDFAKSIFFERYKYFVSKYGKPTFQSSSPNSKFAFKKIKKRRLKDNLAKSNAKQQRLENKINAEKERRQGLVDSVVNSDDVNFLS